MHRPVVNRTFTLATLYFVLLSTTAYAAQITSVKVDGEDNAELGISLDGASKKAPKLSVDANVVDISLPGISLAKELGEKVDLRPSHYLIHRITAYQLRPNFTKIKVVVNGTESQLSERLKLRKSRRGWYLTIEHPKVNPSTLALLKDESKPLAKEETKASTIGAEFSPWKWGLTVLIIVLLAAIVIFGAQFLRRVRPNKGTRRFLIEQLSYSSLGPKSGIALYKIGREFILVGVTASGINFLSSLPRLQQQYEEETKFEEDNFKMAIQDEYKRIKTTA